MSSGGGFARFARKPPHKEAAGGEGLQGGTPAEQPKERQSEPALGTETPAVTWAPQLQETAAPSEFDSFGDSFGGWNDNIGFGGDTGGDWMAGGWNKTDENTTEENASKESSGISIFQNVGAAKKSGNHAATTPQPEGGLGQRSATTPALSVPRRKDTPPTFATNFGRPSTSLQTNGASLSRPAAVNNEVAVTPRISTTTMTPLLATTDATQGLMDSSQTPPFGKMMAVTTAAAIQERILPPAATQTPFAKTTGIPARVVPNAVTPGTVAKPTAASAMPGSGSGTLSQFDTSLLSQEDPTAADAPVVPPDEDPNEDSFKGIKDMYQDFKSSVRDFEDQEKSDKDLLLDATLLLDSVHADMLQMQVDVFDLDELIESLDKSTKDFIRESVAS